MPSGRGLDELAQEVEAVIRSRGCKERGDEMLMRCPCPGHNDERASASYNRVKRAWKCYGCNADGGLLTGTYPLAEQLGIELNNNGRRSIEVPLSGTTHRSPPAVSQAPSQTDPRSLKDEKPTPVGEEQFWPIKDSTGQLVATHHRQDYSDGSKKVWWSRNGTNGLDGLPLADLPMYGADILPERRAGEDVPVIVCEGEKAADCLLDLGLPALGITCGAGGTPGPGALSVLKDRGTVLWPDHDTPGAGLMERTHSGLSGGVTSDVKIFAPEDLPPKGDAVEWVEARKAEGKDPDQIRHELLLAIEEQSYTPATETPGKASKGLKPVLVAPAYKSFPTELFPRPVQHFVKEVSASIGVDTSMVAVQALAVMAGCIGTKRRVRLKHGYHEWGAIWSVVVARSGTLKTPAFRAVTGEVWDRETETIEAHRQADTEYKNDLQAWKDQRRDNRGLKPEPPAPVERRVVNDVTIESLCLLLRDAPSGLLLTRNELAGWLKSFDQYKSGKGSDAQSWLEMYDGGVVCIDRKGSRGVGETISISPALISLTGTVQPSVLRRSLGSENYENGLAARLMMTMPPERPIKWSEDDAIHPATERAWARLLTSLLELEFDEFGKPVELALSDDAKPIWAEWVNTIGQRIHEEAGPIHAALSKLKGIAARIALDVELATDPKSTKVSEAAMQSGVGIAQWFVHEYERVYNVLTEDEAQTERRELAEWLDRQEGGRTTKRKLEKTLRRYYPEGPKDAQEALDDLQTHGYGEWHDRLPVTGRRSGGQPTKDFVLNQYREEYQEWNKSR